MKRTELTKHLRRNGCELLREGSSHSVWICRSNSRQSSIPRHREISDYTVRAICRQLDIPEP